MVSIRKATQTSFKLRRKGQRGGEYNAETVGLVAAGFCIGFLVMFMYGVAFSESSAGQPRSISESLRKMKKHPVLMDTPEDGDNFNNEDPKHRFKREQPMGDSFDAIALEILETLDCAKLLEEAEDRLKPFNYNGEDRRQFGDESPVKRHRRRLQQHADDGGFADFDMQEGKKEVGAGDDAVPEERWGELVDQRGDIKPLANDSADFADDVGPFPDGYQFLKLSAKHLFCLAATENPPQLVKDEIKCDGSKRKRKTLLELWSAARSQMQLDLLLKVLDLARESSEIILGKAYNIWAPEEDEGLSYMVQTLNSDVDVDDGGLSGLEEALGPGKIFVDVGGCLGLTCLVINDKYPGTKIVSIEPASPNWLLQELNLRCNLPRKEFKKMRVIMAGVGANTEDEDNTMAKLMWRSTSTTSTRSWTPSSEFREEDVELIVRYRRLKSILAEADVIQPKNIDVLNLDCQGCEYNLIPTLTKEEFEEIPTVTGSLHWGYIDVKKLPSSKRREITHQRLCHHENFARNKKECCAFPDLPVKSSIPDEILQKNDSKEFLPSESTVSDIIADGLCDDFSIWAKDHYLNEIPDDFGWFELSSQA